MEANHAILLQLNSIDELFVAPSVNPFSTHEVDILGQAGIDIVEQRLLRNWPRRPRVDRLTVQLPADRVTPELVRNTPGALRHYFAKDSEAVAQRYLEQLLQGPIIDFGTLASVLRDCMRAPPPATRSPFTGPVQLLSGTTDPICAGGSDAVGWQAVFPQARYRAVPSGHMVHVELAPDIWFGQAPDAAATGATTATA